MAIMYLSIESLLVHKNRLAYTFLCLNNLLFRNQFKKTDINSLVNSVEADLDPHCLQCNM